MTPGTLRPPGKLRTAASESTRRTPLLALAAVIAAILMAIPLLDADPGFSSLDDVALTGDRGPGCVRLVIASDQSGSMIDFASPREQALAQLLAWTPDNLRPDDEVAVMSFTDHVEHKLAPSSATARPALGSLGVSSGNTTLFDPVISAVGQFPDTPCRTALLLLSDGKMFDSSGNAQNARANLRAAGVSDLYLLVPGEAIEVPDDWTETYPYAEPIRFDGTNPEATGLAFGNSLAATTGQSLEKKPQGR